MDHKALSHSTFRHAFLGHERRLHVVEWGDEKGVPVLFLHGFSEGGFVWEDVVRHMPKGLRCIMLDLRGHGDSGWCPSGNYRTKNYADDVEAVLDELGCTGFGLVGHSLGAEVATEVARRRKACANILVLVDYSPASPGEVSEHIHAQFKAACARPWSVREYTDYMLDTRPFLDEGRALWMAGNMLKLEADGKGSLKADPVVVTGREGENDIDGFVAALNAIPAQTVLLRGEASSVLTRDMFDQLRRQVPTLEVQVIEGAGHAIMTENPKALCAVLRRSLSMLGDCVT